MPERVAFAHGSALALPFADAVYDVVWAEHAQMNIADKGRFYREISRVLRPGGRLVFHDIFHGESGVPHYPTSWTQSAELSALAVPEESRAALQRMQETGPPPLGLHLLMGPTAADKFNNVLRNPEQGRITIVQGVACKHLPEQAGAADE